MVAIDVGGISVFVILLMIVGKDIILMVIIILGTVNKIYDISLKEY